MLIWVEHCFLFSYNLKTRFKATGTDPLLMWIRYMEDTKCRSWSADFIRRQLIYTVLINWHKTLKQ